MGIGKVTLQGKTKWVKQNTTQGEFCEMHEMHKAIPDCLIAIYNNVGSKCSSEIMMDALASCLLTISSSALIDALQVIRYMFE